MNHKLPIKIDLPEHFLEEEVRCGYVVTKKQKKIWAVELDLLSEFMRVCDKYDLKWFVGYGSLLGVIRHKGFIPWDNDIDIAITRQSFNKLCEVAADEFQEPYFLQTPMTEGGRYFKTLCKLCNSMTTGASEMEWLQGINCGLYLDVFILDEIPDDDKKVEKMFKKVHYYNHFARFFSPYPRRDNMKKKLKNMVWTMLWKYKYHSCGGDVLFMEMSDYLSQFAGQNSHRWMALEVTPARSLHLDKTMWSETLMADMEFLKVPIPNDYDWILTDHYGNYMELPPLEMRVNHEYLELEPEIPYKEYFTSNMP
ncbi:MAG: LicD family protein [Bacteroidales bacterium]|nr:LicD family protein [Bacteroidales bacterium]